MSNNTKSGKKSQKLRFLERQPDNAAGMYIESKHNKFFVKERDMDRPAESIELLYVRNLREYTKMERLKKDLLELNKDIALKNKERVEYMKETTDKLHNHFIDTNTFMQDVMKKRALAQERIQVSLGEQQKIRQSIENYRKHISDLITFQNKLKDIVNEMEPYEQIIKEVVQKFDVMSSLKDCMDRCDALTLAQKDISRLKEEKIREIEEKRAQMMTFTHNAAIQVLGIKNKLSELSDMYTKATADCQQWEQVLIQTQNLIMNDTLSKERCSNGISLTYRLLSKRLSKVKTKVWHSSNNALFFIKDKSSLNHHSDVEKMLDFIKDEVEILNKTLEEYKNNNNYGT